MPISKLEDATPEQIYVRSLLRNSRRCLTMTHLAICVRYEKP